jgi:DNA gyrase/topoisomerase IV subunit B
MNSIMKTAYASTSRPSIRTNPRSARSSISKITRALFKMEAALQWCNQDYNENILSYANSVRTADGGTHEAGFKLGITRAVNDWAVQNEIIKDSDKIDGSDIREGLTAIISVKIPEDRLEYEGQTKGKLGPRSRRPSTLSSTIIWFTITWPSIKNSPLI